MNNNKPTNNKAVVREHNLTYDDYASLDDDLRYELVKGSLELMSPASSTIHQIIISEVFKKVSLTCAVNQITLFSSPQSMLFYPQPKYASRTLRWFHVSGWISSRTVA